MLSFGQWENPTAIILLSLFQSRNNVFENKSFSSPDFIAIIRPSYYTEPDLVPPHGEYDQMANNRQPTGGEDTPLELNLCLLTIRGDKNAPHNVVGEVGITDADRKWLRDIIWKAQKCSP